MVLCSKRPEGFGPHSQIHPSLPTTCFLDVIVEPLATWIFILLLPIPIMVYLRSRRTAKKADEADDSPRKSIFARILAAIYYIFIVALLAMQSLEIARLVVADLGIGLLPFTYVGILLAGTLHLISKLVPVRAVSALFWIMLVVAVAMKVAALKEEEGRDERRGVASNYPLGDEVTDTATITGVAFVQAILEFVAR